VIEALVSILGGGLTGVFGKVLERWFDFKFRKLDGEQQLALRRADAEIMREEWAQRTKVAEVEAAASVQVEDSKAFAVSLDDGISKFYDGRYTRRQAWLMVFLDFMRGFIRIGLTGYLCILTTLIYLQVSKLLNFQTILPSMAYDLINLIVQTVLYLTTMACGWQFGSRTTNAPVNK
jgi:hypothetical protein